MIIPIMRKSTSTHNRAYRHRGFSFVELLVSIVLLSMIVVALNRAFFQVSNSVKVVQQSLSAEEHLRLLMKIVLDDLQSVQYLRNYAEAPTSSQRDQKRRHNTGILATRSLIDSGTEEQTTIHFHASVPTRFYPAARHQQQDPMLHEIGYFIEFDPAQDILVFKRREDFYVDGDIKAGGNEQVLSEQIALFQIEFLLNHIKRKGQSSLQEAWVKTWDSDEGRCEQNSGRNLAAPCLPLAIRLTMGVKDTDGSIVQNTMDLNLEVSLSE